MDAGRTLVGHGDRDAFAADLVQVELIILTDLVAKVKPLLEELGNADPAGLMPAETLLYVEIGSPGKQIEAILKQHGFQPEA